jgi:hypothetical protein
MVLSPHNFQGTKFSASIEQMQEWAEGIMKAEPNFIIGDPADPYMKRWWVIPRNAQFNVYLHQILKSDTDEALHDHPFDNTSFLLKGGYGEVMPVFNSPDYTFKADAPTQTRIRIAGDVVERSARDPHRLILTNDEPCISLFITGPIIREWGFYCPKGWTHWKDYSATANAGQKGLGCA